MFKLRLKELFRTGNEMAVMSHELARHALHESRRASRPRLIYETGLVFGRKHPGDTPAKAVF